MIRNNEELLHYVERLMLRDQREWFQRKEFPIAATLVSQDAFISHVYFVKTGLLKCSRFNEEGNEFVQEFFGPGEIFGEIEALETSLKTIASVIALTPCEIIRIYHGDFVELLGKDRVFNEFILRTLARKVSYKAIRHSYSHLHTLEENLKKLLVSFPGIFEVVSKQDIAGYLGVTVRSLNRALKK